MRVGVIGINHKLAHLQLREQLATSCQRRFGAGNCAHRGHAFILLSTCNRTEIYFCSEDLSATHTYLLSILRKDVADDFDQKLYSYFGYDCFLHLSQVTAGLDSAIIAETEIQGQVKAAYEKTLEFHHLPSDLHFLFQKCLKIGKKIRTDFPLKRGTPRLENAIFEAGYQIFSEPHSARVLFVGASETSQKAIHFFRSKGVENLTLCNRTLEKAVAIAQNQQMATLPWSRLSEWVKYDWIILATKAPSPLITDVPAPLSTSKLLIDLAVPRNVAPHLASHPHLTLLNIDQINQTLASSQQHLSHTLRQAEKVIVNSTKTLLNIFQEKERYKFNSFALEA